MKKVVWLGSTEKDLKVMPSEVRDAVGYALYQAQIGQKCKKAKSLKGFGSAGILEVVEDCRGGTFRAVYTVKFGEVIYVLHCFQKKSTHGIATPKPDMDLIRERLKAAQARAQGDKK
jgi:phage-related protein